MFAALIIDADAEAAQHIQTALVGYGFEFTMTQDPVEAMNLARTATPDIIFLRVELPNVSGFSVCNKLRRNDETKYIPLVMYASGVSEDVFSQHRNLKTHADEYLKLPFPAEILITAVQGLIPLEDQVATPSAFPGGDAPEEAMPGTDDPAVEGVEAEGSAEILEVDVVDVEEFDDFEYSSEDATSDDDDPGVEAPGSVPPPLEPMAESPSTALQEATDAAFDALVDFEGPAADGASESFDGDPEDTPSAPLAVEDSSPRTPTAESEDDGIGADQDPLAGFDPAPVPELDFDDAPGGRSTPAFEPRDPALSMEAAPPTSSNPEPAPQDAISSESALEQRPDPIAFEAQPPEPPPSPAAATTEGRSLRTLVGLVPPAPVAPPPSGAPASASPAPSSAPATSAFKSQREVLQLKTQLNAKNREILELKDELEAQQRSVLDAKHKNRELQAQLGELEEKLLHAEEQMINARESAETAVREQGSAAQHLQIAERKNHELEQRLAQLETVTHQLEAASAQVTQLERARAQASAETDALRRQLQDVEATEREEREALREQIERLEGELEAAHRMIEARREVERRAQQALAVALRVLDGQEAAQ